MEGAEAASSLSSYAFRLAVTMFFVALNGFFVAAEFALVKIRAGRIEAMAESGNRRARVTQHILDHLDYYLSACQLGITLASLILGWLAEPAIAELLLAGAHAVGWDTAVSPAVSHAIALAIALSIVTVLHLTIGEQAPKIFAIRRPEVTALNCAYPLRWFSALFGPFIWFINEVTRMILRGVGLSSDEHSEAHDVAEIRSILLGSAKSGHISRRQLQLAENVLHLVDLEVRHILVPRVDVETLSTENTLEQNLEIVRTSGHTRLPLCDGDLDSVVGVLHVKRLLAAQLAGNEIDLRELAREPLFVSETQPLSRLIAMMQRQRAHSGFALDERGSVVGMVFLEDALEHVVGPIRDEFDEAPPEAQELDDGSFRLPGNMAVPEAISLLGMEGGDESMDTIGGLVIAELGRLPETGDELLIGGHRVTVESVSRGRIDWLKFAPDNEEPVDP